MPHSYPRLAPTLRVVQIALLFVPSVCIAQRIEQVIAPSASDDSTGLQLPVDRQLDLRLSAVRRSIEEGDFGAAAALLSQISNADQVSFSAGSHDSTLRPAQAVASHLTELLPTELRKRLESEIDRRVQARWSVAKAASLEVIAEFASLHYATGPGLEALRLLAGFHRDAGRHLQAAAAWKAVGEHPRASVVQRTIAMMARIESLLNHGDLADAQRAANLLSGDEVPESVLIGGKEVRPQEWIARQLDRVRATVPHESLAIRGSQLPAPQPAWTKDISSMPEIQKSLNQLQRYFREQGVVSSVAMRPRVAGNLVITRTMQELQAHDRTTGELHWTIPNQEYSWISTNPSATGNNHQRNAIASAWHRRTEADSVFNSVSTNGELLIIVQEPDRPELDRQAWSGPPRPTPAGSVANARWNKLCGYETSTRQLRWQIGGPPTGPADVFGGANFLGTPIFVDDLLFTIARRDDDLLLMALDQETGHLRWSVRLGILAPHLADSTLRRRVACPITLVDGRLLCPTASGTLAAVNLTTRSIDWAYRYPVLQHDLTPRPVNGSPTAVVPDVWWDEWRETNCVATDDRLQVPSLGRMENAPPASPAIIFVSPDSAQIHAVNRIDGSPLWSSPRAGGLYLAGIANDCAIVVESMAVRAHDVRSGHVRWRNETGEIAGRGAIAGKQFFQCCRTGGILIINTADGSQQSVPPTPEIVAGTLVPSVDGWIIQSTQSVQRVPLLEAVRHRAEAELIANPNQALSIELARLDLHAGDPTAALRRLEDIETKDAKALRREAILGKLNARIASGERVSQRQPTLTSELGQELLSLSDTDEDRLVAMKVLGDAARADGNSVTAMKYYFDGLDLIDSVGIRTLGEWPANETSARTVRVDRVLLAAIRDVLEGSAVPDSNIANSQQREAVEQLLQSRLDTALGDDDPFAIQRMLDQLLPLEWARRSLLKHSRVSLYARPLPKAELLLLSAAGSREPTTAFQALECLAETLSRSGWRLDAEAVQRRILAEYPGSSMSSGQTLSAELATNSDMAELRSRLIALPREGWPPRLPRVEKEAKSNSEVHYVPVRVRTLPGSMLDRLDVGVHRAGRQIRFTGDGQLGAWEITLPPPKVLRSAFANQDQVEAYGIGRVLIVRIGSEIFGILPFNERGEAIAAITSLQVDLAPYESLWYPEPVAAKLGIRHEGARLVDGFGRGLGGLGPVRPGYLCYQSLANLIAVDPLTGRRLWERSDLPANCRIFGDDDFVYLWRAEVASLQTISAIDGRTLNDRSWNSASADLLMDQGRLMWFVNHDQGTVLELKDARDGTVVWTQSLDVKSIPFVVDQGTIGIVKAEGRLQLIAAETGLQIGEELTVEVPDKVERILCLHDTQRWYIAISGPVPRLANLQAQQLWGGLRVSFINGWLYGIERQTTAISWRRFLDSEPLPQYLSHVAPVLVQMWRRYAVGPGKTESEEEGVLRLIDTRTGAEILTHRDLSLHPYSVLNPAAGRESVDVLTQRMTFHLNYAPAPEEGPQTQTPEK